MWKVVAVLGFAGLCYFTNGQECGVKPPQEPFFPSDEYVDPNIVNGREAAPNNWPWQASLKFNGSGEFRHTCGAILIDPYWALTAAHCVEGRQAGLNDSRREDPEYFRLDLGLHDQGDVTTVGAQRMELDMIIRHDRWEPDPSKGFPNDAAMLRLTEPVDLSTPEVELACLPQNQGMNFTREECWISGWGLTMWNNSDVPQFLQEGPVFGITNEECDEIHFGIIRESHICAGTGGDGWPNACNGDSGGPMHCQKDGTWYTVGITSWGILGCEAVPSVYTRISYFKDWMDTIMLVYPPEL